MFLLFRRQKFKNMKHLIEKRIKKKRQHKIKNVKKCHPKSKHNPNKNNFAPTPTMECRL